MSSGLEIERKFVLPEPPDEISGLPGMSIRQRYLALDGDVQVRLRRRDGARLLTIKAGTGRDRAEEETSLEPASFDRLWELAAAREVSKRRHTVPLMGGLRAEIDVYDGRLRGLVTAEVEFASPGDAARFTPPGWLGDEVTEDAWYGNAALAGADAPPPRRPSA